MQVYLTDVLVGILTVVLAWVLTQFPDTGPLDWLAMWAIAGAILLPFYLFYFEVGVFATE